MQFGKWHELVPRDPVENVKFRLDLYKRARSDKAFQASVRAICARDPLFYVNAFAWQFNPNAEGGDEVGPFCTWDWQGGFILRAVRQVRRRRDTVVEKSRELGLSWLVLFVFVWFWHWSRYVAFLLMSRNEALVDSNDPDSLFWKVRFLLRHMPGWLKPATKELECHLENLDLGGTITGTATTKKAGVGGRKTAILLDEFAQMDKGKEIRHRTSDTSRCRFFVGTHVGLETEFYNLTQTPEIDKEVVHWTQHPDKRKGLYRYDEVTGRVEVLDKEYAYPPEFKFAMTPEPLGGPFPGLRSPWYDEQCVRKGDPRAVAMDLDINPAGTVSQFYNPLLIRSLLARACPPYWEGHLLYHVEIEGERTRVKALQFVKESPAVVPPGVVVSGKVELWIVPDAEGQLPRDRYSLGCDPSWGSGATPSCLSGIRCSTSEKVLRYSDNQIEPRDLARLAVAVCQMLTTGDTGAGFIWEQQGPGVQLGLHVLKLGYGNVYYRSVERPDKLSSLPSDRPGWVPAPESKRLLHAEYQAALKSKLTNRDERALKECLSFKYTADGKSVEHPHEKRSGDPANSGVNHGDMVVADALAWKMAEQIGTGQRKKVEEEGPPLLSLAWRRLYHKNRDEDPDAA